MRKYFRGWKKIGRASFDKHFFSSGLLRGLTAQCAYTSRVGSLSSPEKKYCIEKRNREIKIIYISKNIPPLVSGQQRFGGSEACMYVFVASICIRAYVYDAQFRFAYPLEFSGRKERERERERWIEDPRRVEFFLRREWMRWGLQEVR